MSRGRDQLSMTVPPLASHSALVSEMKPWPLQLFMPAQSFDAVLHSPWPLHEFAPAQWILASSAAAAVGAIIEAPESARANAAVAIAAPDLVAVFIIPSLQVLEF